MEEVKLVIFDCDGVLVDSEMISCRVFTEMIRELGVDISESQVYKDLVGGSMAKSIAYVESLLGYKLEREFFTQDYRDRSFEAYKNEMQPVQGITKVLSNLKVPYCVGSNGPQEKIKLNLEITGLDKYFIKERIFSAYDLKKWKPDPALYLHAAEQMKVAPKNCLVVEDSRNGILAAIHAGMQPIGYCPHDDRSRFDDLDVEIVAEMEKILNYI